MSRPFDYGKNPYGKEHRAYAGQQTKHYLGDGFLQHYGAKPSNYPVFASSNYRMGDSKSNGRDSRIDNAIIGHAFYNAGHAEGYDPRRLSSAGISYQQQRNALQQRFDVAKQAYASTGEHKYLMIQKDIRGIADQHLDCDLRSFRLSGR